MDIIHILEFSGMIFSISGSYMASRNEKRFTETVYIAFWLFFFSNLSVLIVAITNQLIPLIIQTLFFFTGSIIVILSRSNNKERDVFRIIYILLPYLLFIMYLILSIDFSLLNFNITSIEVFAAIMAIVGNFIFQKREDLFKLIAFMLFFFADILYVYVAFENSLFFFMTQSAFFIYTSFNGIFNVLKYKKTKEILV